MPVGLNATAPAPATRFTTNGPVVGCGTPLPSYSVEVCVPLFATHAGFLAGAGAIDKPHGLARCGSSVAVPAAGLETSSLTLAGLAAVTVSIAEAFLLL